MDARDWKHIVRRAVAEIVVEDDFIRLLESGRPLRLKQGFDPSRPDIHLGHVVGLRKLRQLQQLGHQVILIVGDWTAQIGDPSGQSATRPMLSAEEVRANAETYMKQFFKVVEKEKTQVMWQSTWYEKFDLSDVIKLSSKFTVAQMMARDDFARRGAEGRPIAITELLYPLLQAYDSVMIEADVEFGGTDQKFNCLVGRELQQMMGQPPQQVFLVPILAGTDGVMKMSKSLGNYIGVDETPREIYGKVMSIPDTLLLEYFDLLTDVSEEELAEFRVELAEGSVNPMTLKQRLAREIVAQFHGQESVQEAEEHFTQIYQRRELPDEMPEHTLPEHTLVKVIGESIKVGEAPEVKITESTVDVDVASLLLSLGLVSSRSEGRRYIAQNAVSIDGQRVTEAVASVRDGSVIRVGRRRFARLRIAKR